MPTNVLLPDKDKCCGCGACSDACSENLIFMTPDEEGFLYPVLIDTEKCIQCKKCERVCPILTIDKIQICSHNIITYAGFSENKSELQSSASGGAATAISRKFISGGGKVFGVVYDENFTHASYQCASSETELEQFKGSKYVQAEKRAVYSNVKSALSNGETVLFIGLPCEVGALKTFLGKEYDSLYTCELICYGPTSAKVASEFADGLLKNYKSKIAAFSVRYKKDGLWTPPYLRAVFENGDIFLKPFYSTDYGHAFSLFPRPSCYNCIYKGDRRVADLTVGDYWGCTPKDAFWNQDGVSAIFVHTQKGRELIEKIPEFKLIETTYEHASQSNSMLFKRREKSLLRDTFSKMFVEHGLHYACKHTKSRKQQVIQFVSRCTPQFVRPLALAVYRKLVR